MQAALEEEALKFLLENEEREKKELQHALQVTTNKGRAYHEVVFVYSIPTTCTAHPLFPVALGS